MNKPRVSPSASRAPAAGGSPSVSSSSVTSTGDGGAAVGGEAFDGIEDYETAVAELEALVERMEDGRSSLEASLAGYQRGVVLVRYCREQLAVVEQKVRVLEAGLLQPFESDVVPADDEGGDR